MDELIKNVYAVFDNPVSEYTDNLDDIETLREFLDVLHPYKFYNLMHQGIKAFCDEYGDYTSDSTDEMIKQTIYKIDELSDQLYEVWKALDEYERNQIWNAIGEGMYSDEVFLGTIFGNAILPGFGGIIGAFFGGRAAGQRVQREVQDACTMYINGLSKYVEIYDRIIREVILPSVFSDFKYLVEKVEQEKQKKLAASSTELNGRNDVLHQLERLSILLKDNMITEEEYCQLKEVMLKKQ